MNFPLLRELLWKVIEQTYKGPRPSRPEPKGLCRGCGEVGFLSGVTRQVNDQKPFELCTTCASSKGKNNE